jgi:hypothetical protein
VAEGLIAAMRRLSLIIGDACCAAAAADDYSNRSRPLAKVRRYKTKVKRDEKSLE